MQPAASHAPIITRHPSTRFSSLPTTNANPAATQVVAPGHTSSCRLLHAPPILFLSLFSSFLWLNRQVFFMLFVNGHKSSLSTFKPLLSSFKPLSSSFKSSSLVLQVVVADQVFHISLSPFFCFLRVMVVNLGLFLLISLVVNLSTQAEQLFTSRSLPLSLTTTRSLISFKHPFNL